MSWVMSSETQKKLPEEGPERILRITFLRSKQKLYFLQKRQPEIKFSRPLKIFFS
jgi:hypothetical protein